MKNARRELARQKAGLECARKLEAAADALNKYMSACADCDDSSAPRANDDGRISLVRNIMEYATYLNSVYNK